MKAISLNFKIHQPYRLKRYRFFSIGTDHIYADDTLNNQIMTDIANNCYYELNSVIVDAIKKHKEKIKVGISASGVALQQILEVSPATFASLKTLADTGNAEFISQTYSHSLVSLSDEKEFKRQVTKHTDYIKSHFGLTSKTFCNTGMIYSNQVALNIEKLGFKTAFIEGDRSLLDWRSPNFIYTSDTTKSINLIPRNSLLCDEFKLKYQESKIDPKTAAKSFVEKLRNTTGDVIMLYVDYGNFHNLNCTNSAEYLKAILNEIAKSEDLTMMTPTEVAAKFESVGLINSPNIVSGIDNEKDHSAWMLNYMQTEAFEKLFSVGETLRKKKNENLYSAWDILQSSDHLLYISTKTDNHGKIYNRFSPYPSPYEAFINYMNILSDFILQVKKSE